MRWRTNLWALSLATFIGNIAFTMTNPFLPVFLQELGLHENLSIWSGYIISLNFLTYALMAPVWGALADRYGKRVMLVRSGFGIAFTYVLMGFATNHWQLLILRGCNGLLSGFIPASIMLIASNTPEEKMGYALGIINTFIAIGAIMGPFVGGCLVQYLGMRKVMFVAAGFLCIASSLGVFRTTEKVVKQKGKITLFNDMRAILKNRQLVTYFFCMVMLYMSNFAIQPTLPLLIGELTSTNTELITGIIFSMVGVSLAIGSPLICKIKKVSYIYIMFGALLFCSGLSVVQGFTRSIVLLGVERFFYGFGNAAINVSGNVLIVQCVDEEMRGRVFGTLNGFTAIGAVTGPLMGGFMGEHFGNSSSFHGSAVLFLLAAYAVWTIRKQRVQKVSACAASVSNT